MNQIKHIIAVASGKGGVGKSTVAANLAVALAQSGLKVGLMDADIYGPSVPRMLGVHRRPESEDGKTLIPLEAHGIKLMSMGFMVDERTAMIWRGLGAAPMASTVLTTNIQTNAITIRAAVLPRRTLAPLTRSDSEIVCPIRQFLKSSPFLSIGFFPKHLSAPV